jgi:hypothetical protein
MMIVSIGSPIPCGGRPLDPVTSTKSNERLSSLIDPPAVASRDRRRGEFIAQVVTRSDGRPLGDRGGRHVGGDPQQCCSLRQ